MSHKVSQSLLLIFLASADALSASSDRRQPVLRQWVDAGPPVIRIKMDEGLAKCLAKKSHEPNAPIKEQVTWEMSCTSNEFTSQSALVRVRRPDLRMAVGMAIHREILKLRSEFLKNKQQAENATDAPGEPSSSEADFLNSTEPWLELADEWLSPLYNQSQVLDLEASTLHFTILGDALRFEKARQFLATQGSNLLRRPSSERAILSLVQDWVEDFGHPALKDWLRSRLEMQRPDTINGERESELDFWLASLKLAPFPKDKEAKSFVLSRLKRLSIAYPKEADQRRIQETADQLGLNKLFSIPTTATMTFDELMLRAQAQVRAVDALGALRTLRRIRDLPKDATTEDQTWDALQFHVRVLRILDERPQIPAVVEQYISRGGFLEKPSIKQRDRKRLSDYYARVYNLARIYWNYDTPDRAEKLLDQIITGNEADKTEHSLGPALAVKARIAEQARDAPKAYALIDRAMKEKLPKDLRDDLVWRKLFLLLDDHRRGNGTPIAIQAAFDDIKKVFDRDPTEKGRLAFWQAQIHLRLNKKDLAIAEFETAYATDPLSYYSNFAGLHLIELGARPTGWRLNPVDGFVPYESRRWDHPNWELFFSSSGQLRDPLYKDLARVYFLSLAGDLQSAQAAFSDLDRSVWQIVLPSKRPWERRRDFSRAVSWIRTALEDPMGALKASEVARQANGNAFEEQDFLHLYPLPFWAPLQDASGAADVSPWLAASLIRQESAFNPKARSWANALGLMQMIPPVAKEEARLVGLESFQVDQLFDSQIALRLGTHHLGRLTRVFDNSWICATAAYNAGTPPVLKWLRFYGTEDPLTFIERIPFRETQGYVKSILRNYTNYQRIYGTGEFSLQSALKMPSQIPENLVSLDK